MARSIKETFRNFWNIAWLFTTKVFLAELVAAVRRRGRGDSDEDEDLGLPHSPPASPPTDKAEKRHHAGISQSSCSDGSLLSVGSSEMDDDSSSGHQLDQTRHEHSEVYTSSEPPSGVAPLSHSAARHKMAVRPRRNHALPRRKKNNSIAASALPITPELNEEMTRSTTPEVILKSSEVVTESFSSTTAKHHMIVKDQHQQLNRELQKVLETPSDTKLKSSSLPPGLALSQLVGQSPVKLSIADNNTPRSSIKRSKSSTQEQPIRESSPKLNESRQPEDRNKHRSDKKQADEPCLEKKTKSEKKVENEVIRSSKKEESFFSRLLLRKSGKKSKKDQTDGDGQQDVKKTKTEKTTAQYKPVDSGCYYEQGYKHTDRSYKSAGQKAFANQMHKRIDNKGAYVHEGAYKDVYSAAKVTGLDYSIDLKAAEETDKMLNYEMKNRFSRRDEFCEKIEKKRSSSKEAIDDKRESFNLHHDKSKRPASVQRLIEPFSTKTLLANELANRTDEDSLSPTFEVSDEDSIRGLRIKNVNNDCVFHSGSMPKNIPYFNPSISVSVSPVKSKTHSSENVKYMSRSTEADFHGMEIVSKRENVHHVCKTDEPYVASGLRSLGDEYVETRSSIGKSHSFRYASQSSSISSQENQLPSLPAIVGISEPLLESWEVNYRRNVSERHDHSKRISARNYNILSGESETNYDSLPSTDSSYLDSLKQDMSEERKLFTNSIQITIDTHKRDSDISQIEAKIDDIISSPKPIISPILKSSSLDSVKSSPEKPAADRRKTISVESAIGQSNKNIQKELKQEPEGFISVTHINRDNVPVVIKAVEISKINKSDEKIQKTVAKSGVPEFLNIQLNKVDAKPVTNVVLTANVSPKKIDSPQPEKEPIVENFAAPDTQISQNVKTSKEITKTVDDTETVQVEEKPNVVVARTLSTPAPQSPMTPKHFFKKKLLSVDSQEKIEKQRTSSVSTEGSIEKIDNISMDQKSHSSFGSKSSIQSIDSDENKIQDRQEEAVVYRRKPFGKDSKKHDDEPELMKVFARRSLKLKDSEADHIAQDIADTNKNDNVSRSKILKNEFNASIKSRDSDKENEEQKEQAFENKLVDIAARVSQFGNYQRSVSISSVTPKRDSAPAFRSDVNKYKKEVSDSTPEKRLRNRTFPDSSNDREDIKNVTKNEAMGYKADTLTKRPWQRTEFRQVVEKEKRDVTAVEKDGNNEKSESGKEKEEADASPQFKGILQMRAEWERRAQGMTK
ncbi:uncharacterized protein LOC116774337 isoform X2 [Danaus plexippus]|uniref:uncharacterized protein LOC116774337 isoform X2 n=1 Tax=Danaus plexippus TaxID=13037 RepID=UPI002AB144E7|nr:uncharacterized protein LOC116774337 isoform X2 [Danaus plexippus]